MKYLYQLIDDDKLSELESSINIDSLCYDSRRAKINSLFFAVKGFKFDGNDYVKQAIVNGAVAIISEKVKPVGLENIYWRQVKDIRDSMALISYRFYQENLEKLYLIGVTGTNGKTTTSYIIEHILNSCGIKCGLVGTLGIRGLETKDVSSLTTPESIDLHQYFSQLVENEIRHAVMEVSSHSIALKRINYLPFKIGIFTNLTRDHLDFHKTTEDYFNTKKRLFINDTEVRLDKALINVDDKYGKLIIGEREKLGKKTYSYGFSDISDYKCLNYEASSKGIQMELDFMGKKFTLRSKLIGYPNVYNLLAASAVADLIGIDSEMIIQAILEFNGVKGRYEYLDYGQEFLVLIDYAHTEDAIENLLKMVRKLSQGRIILVFGCGGDRDKGKRRLMGRVAAENADYLIITSDNPRSEDPLEIIEMIMEGVKEGKESILYEIIIDREEAIHRAIKLARKGDIVILAGKGHENYQIIGNNKLYFEEREIVKQAIERIGK